MKLYDWLLRKYGFVRVETVEHVFTENWRLRKQLEHTRAALRARELLLGHANEEIDYLNRSYLRLAEDLYDARKEGDGWHERAYQAGMN